MTSLPYFLDASASAGDISRLRRNRMRPPPTLVTSPTEANIEHKRNVRQSWRDSLASFNTIASNPSLLFEIYSNRTSMSSISEITAKPEDCDDVADLAEISTSKWDGLSRCSRRTRFRRSSPTHVLHALRPLRVCPAAAHKARTLSFMDRLAPSSLDSPEVDYNITLPTFIGKPSDPGALFQRRRLLFAVARSRLDCRARVRLLFDLRLELASEASAYSYSSSHVGSMSSLALDVPAQDTKRGVSAASSQESVDIYLQERWGHQGGDVEKGVVGRPTKAKEIVQPRTTHGDSMPTYTRHKGCLGIVRLAVWKVFGGSRA